MTSDNLLDELADYAAGLLEPAAARDLTRRLAADPQLAALASAMGAAQDRVGGELRDLAGEPMPPAVADRLSAALAAAGAPESDPTPAAERPASGPGRTQAAAGPHRRAQPDRTGRPPGRPDGRAGGSRPAGRSRWVRLLAAAGGVAAAAVLVIGGFAALGDGTTSGSGTSMNAGKGSAAPQFAGAPVIRHSNTDYTAATLPTGPDTYPAADTAGGMAAQEGTGDLARLGAPEAVTTCLAAVTAAHPGTVTVVEYARYERRPALIVVVQSTAGGTRTVVVGPDCGLPGSGDDEVYVTPAR
jgi:hypothetical protein